MTCEVVEIGLQMNEDTGFFLKTFMELKAA